MSKKVQNEIAVCDLCGAAGLRTIKVSRLLKDILIENIPEHHCAACGEVYYTTQTMEFLDEARANPGLYAHEKQVLAITLS